MTTGPRTRMIRSLPTQTMVRGAYVRTTAAESQQHSKPTSAGFLHNRGLPQLKFGPWKAALGGTIPFTSTLKRARSLTATVSRRHQRRADAKTFTVCVTMEA